MNTTSMFCRVNERRDESHTRLVASAAGWELTTDLMPTMRRLVAFDHASTEVALYEPRAVRASASPTRPTLSRPPSGEAAAWSGGPSTSGAVSRPLGVASTAPPVASGEYTAATTTRDVSSSSTRRSPRVPGIVFALVGFILSCGTAWAIKDLVASSGSDAPLDATPITHR